MNIRRLIIVVISGLLLVAVLVFVAPGVLSVAASAGSLESHLEQDATGDTGRAIPQAVIGPTSVSIVPAKLGVAGASYTFVATVVPTNTTLPISYTWQATGQSSVAHITSLTDTVSFTWPVTGSQVVTVTAANSWGTAIDTYSIFVSDLPALDTVVSFDVSGSTDFETNCFGCWNEVPALSADIINNPFPINGNFNPVDYNIPDDANPVNNINIYWGGNPGAIADTSVAGHPVCNASPTSPIIDASGFRYQVHEAEFYSADVPINGWEFNKRVPGQGFWVIQRLNRGSNGTYIRAHPFVTYSQHLVSLFPRLQGAAYNHECFSQGQCWKTRAAALGEDYPSNTPPYVEYDFNVTWENETQSNTHVWIRAIGGSAWSLQWSGQTMTDDNLDWRETIYWQVDGTPYGTDVKGGPFDNLANQGISDRDFVDDNTWRWVKIGGGSGPDAIDLPNGLHTLRLYQGSTGFNLDKIIITNNPDGNIGLAVRNSGAVVGSGSISAGFSNLLQQSDGEGPDATAGSATREACNLCNPAFGHTAATPAVCSCKTGPGDTTVGSFLGGGTGTGCTNVLGPTNHLMNDLFHDIDPLRSAQEAVKNFAAQLDPRFDQLGIVTWDDTMEKRMKLQCLRYEETNNAVDGEKACWDPATGPVTYTRVIQLVEDQVPNQSTDISLGMKEGLEELGVSVPGENENINHGCSTDTSLAGDKQACDRQGAAQRVLILITDGSPNENVGCPASYEWRGLVGASNNAFDCSMFYAHQAADNEVAVYTIGLGPGVPIELLTAMAEGTDPNPAPGDDGFYFQPHCGQFFHAANLNDLDAIFTQILALARSCAQPAIGGPPPNPQIWAVNGYEHTSLGNIVVHLDDHEPGLYDIYLEDISGTYRICANVVTDAGGSTNPDPICSLAAVNPPPGLYDLYSTAAATTGPRVATANQLVQIIAGSNPSIAIAGGNFWAANETTELTLLNHPVISGTTYDVKLFAPDGTTELQTIMLSHSGHNTVPIDWLVPDVSDCPVAGPDFCIIRSLDGATVVAEVEVKINQPFIILSAPSNGVAYVRGETVNITLKKHTPGRAYNIKIPSPLGADLVFATSDTNAVGDAAPIAWVIPQDCGFGLDWPDGDDYLMTSHPLGKMPIIASTTFDVFTTSSPDVTIDGGTTWPAGSTINIRVLRHLENAAHYLQFDGVRIPTAAADDTFITAGCGEALITYTIPITVMTGTYTIASFNLTDTQQATVGLTIQASAPPSEPTYLPVVLKE